ncbi:hypothetical protein AOX55_00002692 [Sinorhizobium fredii CCBAU 25509]|nr:hypothetical protein AOX55_00002692 [Sinorhizobium fredii CCBAU 25509]
MSSILHESLAEDAPERTILRLGFSALRQLGANSARKEKFQVGRS